MNLNLLRIFAGIPAGALVLSAQPTQSSPADPGIASDPTPATVTTTNTTTEVSSGGALNSSTIATSPLGGPSRVGTTSPAAVDPIGPFRSGQAPVRDLGMPAGAGLPTGAASTQADPVSPNGMSGVSTLSAAPSSTAITSRPVSPGVSPGTDPIGPVTTITTTTTQRPIGVSPQPERRETAPAGAGTESRVDGPRPIGDTSVSTTVVPSARSGAVPPQSTLSTSTAPTAVAVTTPPPAAPTEPMPAAPGENYVWVRGHYTWSDGQWTWTDGRWELPPQPGMVWVDSRFDQQTQRWMPGYWATNTPTPTGR